MANEAGVPEILEDIDNGGALKLELYRRPDNTLYLRVRLRSIMKPGLWSNLQINMADHGTARKRAGMAAEALAGYQAEMYSDPHDPAACVAATLRAYDRLVASQGW